MAITNEVDVDSGYGYELVPTPALEEESPVVLMGRWLEHENAIERRGKGIHGGGGYSRGLAGQCAVGPLR